MRTAFVNRLIQMARNNNELYLLTGDLGYSVFEAFSKEFPDRFINVGISEANMIGVAAGLAMMGKVVYVYSIIPFLTMRCFEQIRIDLCYQNLNVKLIGVGGGLSYGSAGATHHAIEDIAIMRALPNMTVICPGDPYEAEEAVEKCYSYKGPVYIRLNRDHETRIHEDCPRFEIGKAITIMDGTDMTIFTTGNMLEEGVEIANKLKDKQISVNLISMHTVKPLDVQIITESSTKTKAVFTLEEHNIIGGLASAVAEVLIKHCKTLKHFKAYGIPDSYAHCSGSRDYFRKIYKIDTMSIVNELIPIFGGEV